MWHLDTPSKKTIKWFLDTFLNKVVDGVKGLSEQGIKDILLPNGSDIHVIRSLMIASPRTLYDYAKYLEEELKSKGLWTEATRKEIQNAFNYDGLLSSNKENSYTFAEKIGRNTCTYCNRIYSFTIVDDEKGEQIVRPDLDHWLSKADHPLTSMSIYNLIPSCPICNRGIKHTREFKRDQYIHPYETEADPKFKFHYRYLPNGNVDVYLHDLKGKEANTADFLKTEQVYKPHGNLDIKPLLTFLLENDQQYLNELHTIVMQSFGRRISQEEAYRYIMGTESDPTRYLDRPLSKLKKDVLDQIYEQLGIKLI